ncbi:methionine--tRNA ligase, mitochondrial [Anabrus simplex]|uniref:methionine--tRNA ligase, mitochondrial n=1 Tax=Anabrus simplex TaxID=316456 RepID=UPI0035A2F925
MKCSKNLMFCKNIFTRYPNNLKNTFYITTPIFYVNASPHIGHLYSAVIADAAHRFYYLLDHKRGILSTGTDEHGIKIQQSAAKHNTSLLEYCTAISQQYQSLFEQCDIDFTDFLRTTEDRHKKSVHYFWECLKAADLIYPGIYSGWYCVQEESFLGNTQLKDGLGKDGKLCKVSAESGHPVEWTTENNFMFRLSSLQNDLLYWLKDERVVQPLKFHHQLVSWVQDETLVQDVSVSRPKDRVHWGIPVPDDSNQIIYVWLEALVNYLTVAGYPDPSYQHLWPPDLQIIGKDILRFHGIYWPAFLIGAGLEPPRMIFCHSHWTVNGEKMSKSKGNVVRVSDALDQFTASGLRYFLLREGVAHNDGNYSETKAVHILNAELADTFGNLLNRCCGAALNPLHVFPKFCQHDFDQYCSDDARRLVDTVSALPDAVKSHFGALNFYKGIDVIIATLHEANRFFESQKPWELKKSPELRTKLDFVLHLTMETLRVCGIALQPIVPELCNILLQKLEVPPNQRFWSDIRPFSWEQTSQLKDIPISSEKVTLFKKLLKPKNESPRNRS